MKNKYLKIIISFFLLAAMMLSTLVFVGCDGTRGSQDATSQTTDTDITLETTYTTSDTGTDETESDDVETSAETVDTSETEETEGTSDTEETEDTEDTEDTRTEDTEDTDETAGTPEPEEPPYVDLTGITLVRNQKTDFAIVIADGAAALVDSTSRTLKAAFSTYLGVSISIKSVSEYKSANGGSLDGAKIVLGDIGDGNVDKELESVLRDSEFYIEAKDDSLYIIGGTIDGIYFGVNYFIDTYIKSAPALFRFDYGMIFRQVLDKPIDDLSIAGNGILKYSIVYYDSVYAKACAESIQKIIRIATGYTIPIYSVSTSASEYEILVGKTNRTEAKALRGAYDRPNVYYDVEVVGSKLIIMAEGYRTLAQVETVFKSFINSLSGTVNLTGSLVSGDILAQVDAVDCMTGALEVDPNADLRVLHWNMAAPLSWDQAGTAWGANWPFKADEIGRRQRGEQQADTILIYNPDIITTNEIYIGHANGHQYAALIRELSEYFTVVDSNYDTRDTNMPSGVPTKDGNNASYGNPEGILIRKNKLKVVDSGWRYLSDGTQYHGIHWAILEVISSGKKFIASVGHYGDARTEVTYAEEHLAAIAFAQKCSGSSEPLPAILTGDMYTWVNHSGGRYGAGYKYLDSNGYDDSQVSATLNCNDVNGTLHGTFHDPMNDSNKARASEDFVWYNNKLVSTKFGVITTPESTNTSDHWPVFADLKFN